MYYIMMNHWIRSLKSKLLIKIPIATKRLKCLPTYRWKIFVSILQNINAFVFVSFEGTRIIFFVEGCLHFPPKERV